MTMTKKDALTDCFALLLVPPQLLTDQEATRIEEALRADPSLWTKYRNLLAVAHEYCDIEAVEDWLHYHGYAHVPYDWRPVLAVVLFHQKESLRPTNGWDNL